MKLSLKTLIDPQKMALARARLHAWWEGEAFDPASVASADAVDVAPPAFQDIPEPPAEPRLKALEILWGEGRLGPGADHDDRLQPARIGLPATGTLAVFGAGLEGPIVAAAEAHPGEFIAYEWREEAQAHLAFRLGRSVIAGRAKPQNMDLDLFSAPAETWDGAWSLDEFSFAPNPSRLAMQLFKGLKPAGVAVLETYIVDGRGPAAGAFASAFAEPQLMNFEALTSVITAAGFGVEEQEDLTAAHLDAVKEGFRRLEQALSSAQALGPGVAREIAWEAESWAHRMAAMNAGRLTRRRVVARKPE
jgi:hypothetical protein